jgi:cytochrome c556
MRSSTKRGVFGAALALAWISMIGLAVPQDAEQVVKRRQALMNRQGDDLKAIKEYLDGKGDLAKAQASAADLIQASRMIADMFPPGTSTAEFPGKSGAKPAIWSDRDKFVADQKTAAEKTDVLLVAVKSGDKAAITAAFGDLGKNGCGNCHTTFREKIEH